MADLVRFHVLQQENFDPNGFDNTRAIEEEFLSFSAAKKAANAHYSRYRKPLVVTQTNPRRAGPRHNVRMSLG